MNHDQLNDLLTRLCAGQISQGEVVDQLRRLPVESFTEAQLDHHRCLRTGIPEIIFGQSKTADQIQAIIERMHARRSVILATRVDNDKAEKICKALPYLHYDPIARLLIGNQEYAPTIEVQGEIVLVTAGSSDLPIAEEARLTLELFGHPTKQIYDSGVAGIHRILGQTKTLQQAAAIIVIAGMEGALPSVVAGLTDAPVIGVPTSVGYGTGAGGFSALLGMLNSCSPGLAVVNIDNGFGAACMAAAINRIRS
ncbi:nickel pincer cofactor biosynthesis protein LarB [Desulfogranum japonicum]|uniref:nickel pincer cofactor biosynthesis protein LarB n=1 Tax=Desulfogranum japonicum TaxID=231447 RepID=UPI00041B4922|nr:nickel pincer cofactor biosynthesis protein LarB [Desulfogranum japonicum]